MQEYTNPYLRLEEGRAVEGLIRWKSPSNIAIVKYWGKFGQQLPRNPSISFTLQNAFTDTLLQYFNPLNISALDVEDYKKYLSSLSPEEAKFLESPKFFYEITFKNKGGLVMPLILKFEYTDGNTEELRIPAEI